MEKEKASRKKSVDVCRNLPIVPPCPTESTTSKLPPKKSTNVNVKLENEPFSSLYGYKEREMAFLKSLNENIKSFDSENSSSDANAKSCEMNRKVCEDECHAYIQPLLSRTNDSITTLLATKDALDQLDSLHKIVKQLLSVQEQNYRMRRRLRTVETLSSLKAMEIQINTDPEKFIKSSMEENSDTEMFELEFEQNMVDLEAILNSGRSASKKRNFSKRQRSKSIMSDEMSPSSSRDNDRNYPLRRQSAVSDFKPKVSKWTKVKAAFKWEKANALPLNESKSTESILTPNNNELARYLRVPALPCGGSSGDSIFSSAGTSGRILNSATSGTPLEISSASSGDEEEKNSNNKAMMSYHDEERRSHSLDGDLILGTGLMQHLDKTKNKSAWSKVKGIVKTRSSRKSVKSTGSNPSRDVSPIEGNDSQRDRTDSLSSSNQQSPSHIGVFNLNIPDNDCPGSGPNSPLHQIVLSSDDYEFKYDGKPIKNVRVGKKGSRKSKHIPEIESLPEGIPLEWNYRKIPPSPLNLQKDFSESDGFEGTASSPNFYSKISLNRQHATSVPNSPSKAMEFFSENDCSSGGDYSEPLTPQKRNSNSSKGSRQKDEIMRNYHELQKKINMEFASKQTEWEKIRPLVVSLNNSVPGYLKEDASIPGTPKITANFEMTEENLSADFKKKLNEWRIKKNQQSLKESSNKKASPNDWQLWKTGQMKFENQGLIAMPDAKDLPEDFQKKLSEWKQMKAQNRVPSYQTQQSHPAPLKRLVSKTDSNKPPTNPVQINQLKKSKTFDEGGRTTEGLSKLKAFVTPEHVNKEIVVQTSKGIMKFEGISRKFTRKLYEWEKARGIGPESSTFALLHPGYQPVNVEQCELKVNKREKSPGMKRCLSVDSISPNPNPSAVPISHQPSSLSLNDADNFKETEVIEKKCNSSNLDFYGRQKDTQETDVEEPEAVIVEVEDDAFEITTPIAATTPITQTQIPIFKFDLANRDSRSDSTMDTLNSIKELQNVFSSAKKSISDIYLNSEVSITNIKHLTNIFKFINQTLNEMADPSINDPKIHTTKMEAVHYSFEISRAFEDVEDSFCKSYFQDKMPDINNNVASLKKSLHLMHSHFVKKAASKIIPDSNGHQATRTVQSLEDGGNNVATVNMTPTFLCNSIKFNDVQNVATLMQASSETEIPGTSTTDVTNDEKITGTNKKVTRNTSNGSKRRIRIRRMGSRQSSKTESDSEEELAAAIETTRKIKRKTSRAKKPAETTENHIDEVAYVFKMKPGEKNEVTRKSAELIPSLDDIEDYTIPIPPPPLSETFVQFINIPNNNVTIQMPQSFSNAIVKTKRKIFSPVDNDSVEGTLTAVVSREIESSSASDKNEAEKLEQHAAPINSEIEETKISNLPPLPSPKVQRKQDANKELSPNIRLMIEKYNQRVDKTTGSPLSSGTSSPIWRSPVLDRRVRKQSEEYQEKLLKSNSFSEVSEKYTEDIQQRIINEESTNENILEGSSETLINDFSRGAIPKERKFINTITIQTDIDTSSLDSPVYSETVHMRSNDNKPRTPLSERAQKIKQAKEAFLKTPLMSHDSSHSDWSYRLSQISVGSNDSSIYEDGLMKCMSAGAIESPSISDNKSLEIKSLSASLPRDNRGLSNDSEITRDSPKGSRFGLSTLATKLRKVKLKRGTKEISKMNAIPVLCRQSLAVDFSSSGEIIHNDATRRSTESVPKSTSSHGISLGRFKRFEKSEKIKKSKSLGLLES